MIDKKILESLISRYEKRAALAETADCDDDYAFAIHQVFDDLLVELRIKSGLLPLEQFLQDKLSYDNIKISKLSEQTFEASINRGDLIDESKTAVCSICDFQFVIKSAISAVSSQASTAERVLKEAVKTYSKIKEQQ